MFHTRKLYSKSKNTIRWWQAHAGASYDKKEFVDDPNAPAYVWTTYGVLGGKTTTSKLKPVEGKNTGKKNATTPMEQAKLMIESLCRGRIQEGMKLNREDLEQDESVESLIKRGEHRVNVMLLHPYQKYKSRIRFPCWVQPKLDGTHFVVFYHPDVGVDAYTRGKTKVTAQLHITRAFECLRNPGPVADVAARGVYITGELWLPGIPRQTIESITNQEKWENVTVKLDFNVFDVFWIGCKEPFATRAQIARCIVDWVQTNTENCPVKFVETVEVQTPEQVEEYFHKQEQAGMEGIVVRNTSGLYEYGIYKPLRSYNVLKYKVREDGEYRIVDVREGAGGYEGCAIFVLETSTGKRFSASAPGSIEEKKRIWQTRDAYIGRMCTVQFDGLSQEGVPLQPVVTVIHAI